MSEEKDSAVLVLDEELAPKITLNEALNLKPIQKKFMENYLKNRDTMPVEKWLTEMLVNSLPDYSTDEVTRISTEMINTLQIQEEKKKSLQKAIHNGRSKESWFASETKTATSYMSMQEASQYLKNLDDALSSANEALNKTIYIQGGTGSVNQNPNLDGYIAEQYHTQQFNLKAAATGSPYRAKVLGPGDKGYSPNSVDIVIVDKNGHIVKRYQSKYCKDAASTLKAFADGDYRGQRKLVPQDQKTELEARGKKVTDVITAPDGTSSVPLTKEQAKELQKEAQSGTWNELNWNEYEVKDLAVGIGKQAGQAAVMGAAIGVGVDIAQKVWNGEEIDGEELVETAITTGTDIGVKAAAAGALKVGVEKGIVMAIPKGTPASTITNIVHVAVENVKIAGEMASGELTAKEGIEKMQETTVSTVAGIAASTKGASIGAAIGSVLGPVGSAVGGFIGGSVGYMAGSKMGKAVTKIHQKVKNTAKEAIKSVAETARNIGSCVVEAAGNIGSAILGLFGF